ncbi:MAG: hypothetical protein RL757_2173 [Bacteroidota bacterium]|jgi:putative ABC transport system permease protein
MNIFYLAWKNLRNKPLSLLLTTVLFSLGIGLTGLLLLLSNQLESKFEKNLAGINLVIGAKGSPLQLVLCNMYHIDAPTGNIKLKQIRGFLKPHPIIEKAYPLSLGDSYHGYRIVGTDTSFVSLYKGVIAQGKLYETTLDVCLGAAVAASTGLKVGDKFRSSHGLIYDTGDKNAAGLTHEHDEDFRVTGIFAPTGSVLDQIILTPTSSVWAVHEGHDAENDGENHEHTGGGGYKPLLEESDDREITSVLVRFKGNNFQSLNMARNINENTEMQAASPAIEINRIYSMLGVGEDALRALAMLIILVSGLSVFISLFSSLRERQYELALMRVMGAGRWRLFAQILLEGLLLAIVGFVIGIALAHGAMNILAKYMTETYRYTFTGWTWLSDEWWLLAAALGIGLVAAIIPAIRAYSTDISKTLSEN